MMNVSGGKILGFLVLLTLASGCGRATTVTTLTNSIPASSGGSSAASSGDSSVSTASQLYVFDKTGSVYLFTIDMTSGNLAPAKITAAPLSSASGTIKVGKWVYEVNSATNSVELYSSDKMSVVLERFTTPNGVSGIALN